MPPAVPARVGYFIIKTKIKQALDRFFNLGNRLIRPIFSPSG
jgi:hypothetical protein